MEERELDETSPETQFDESERVPTEGRFLPVTKLAQPIIQPPNLTQPVFQLLRHFRSGTDVILLLIDC